MGTAAGETASHGFLEGGMSSSARSGNIRVDIIQEPLEI